MSEHTSTVTGLAVVAAVAAINYIFFSKAQRPFTTSSSPSQTQTSSQNLDKHSAQAIQHAIHLVTKQQQALIARAWGTANGLIMGDEYNLAPITILPTAHISRNDFQNLMFLSPELNLLYDAISRHETFLSDCLEETAKHDEFVGKLLEIYEEHGRENMKNIQPILLGIHRSDYMLDEEKGFLQVEFNTIASSFGFLASRVSDLHRFMLKQAFAADGGDVESVDWERFVPRNETPKGIANAFATAVGLYGETGEYVPCVVMVVQPDEKNWIDQRGIEYALWHSHSVLLIRRTFAEIYENGKIDSEGHLVIDEKYVACVTYLRAGYVPRDYDDDAWKARSIIEQSKSIKCPQVAYQLSGTKRVQQELVKEGILEQFAASVAGLSEESVPRLRAVFAAQWNFEDEKQSETLLQLIEDNSEDYVLKPQREGGGYNYYGAEISVQIKKLTENLADEKNDDDLKAYVLMSRIKPEANAAVMLPKGETETVVVNSLSEFGIFSSFLGTSETVFLNQYIGHLLRTKKVGVDEGGVSAGYAVLDSPLLED